MYVILLKFAANRKEAGRYMDAHKTWLTRGFDDGVFLLAGSLQANSGGAILAQGASLADLETRLQDDPFVTENVVSAEILQLTPSRADPRLQFLLG